MTCHSKIAVLVSSCLTIAISGCNNTANNEKSIAAAEWPSDAAFSANDDAATIVAKAMRAHGGETAVSRWKCGYVKYKTNGWFIPAQFGEVIVEDTFHLPGHFRREARGGVNENKKHMVSIVNQGKTWTTINNGPAVPTDNSFAERAEHPFADAVRLSLLTDKDTRLTKLGTTTINGKTVVGIRGKAGDLLQIDFYFDVQTGRLRKITKKVTDAAGRSTIANTTLDDYREFQGIPFPTRMVGTLNGNPFLDNVVLELKFADSFDESVFAVPSSKSH